MKVVSRVAIIGSVAALGLIWSCARVSDVTKAKEKQGSLDLIPHSQVHFSFDNDEIFLKDIEKLAENAEWLKRNREAVVILEGHCDEHGTDGYNMELGDRRARTVKSHLVERGVPHDKIIMVVSFGESRPADPDHNSSAWQVNRRVEFILR